MSETPQEKGEVSGGDVDGQRDDPQSDKPSVAKRKDKTKAKDKSKGTAANIVPFGKDIEIHIDERFPEHDSGDVKAYRAIKQGKGIENLVAMVCERHLVPRTKAAVVYDRIMSDGLIKLVDFGVVYWKPGQEERCVFFYKDVLGAPLLKKDAPACMAWKQESVMDIVVEPVVAALEDLRDKEFFHGAIRPDNMFNIDKTSNFSKVVLGDCLSSSVSSSQPALFETIERSMADPVARGVGTQRDDLYSFGVSLAVMMRTNDPLVGLSDEEVIQQKIEHGSYVAITGKDRFKGSILELLRGLLHDDPMQRWTIDEVSVWIDGLRLSPKQAQRQKKPARPLSFLGNKYFYIPLLAMDLDVDSSETFKLVDSEELSQWLERSVENEELTERVEEARRLAKDMGPAAGHSERLVACLSSALDPMAPLRYKGVCLNGDGIGAALANALISKKPVNVFVEMFQHNIAMNWLTASENPSLDVGALVGKFDSCRNYLLQTKAAFGIERCLYALCPEAQCLSEKLVKYFVTTPEHMIASFEDLCAKGQAPAFFLDRHSIAFLSVRDPRCVDSYLYDLDSPDEHRKILANLKSLAVIQRRGNTKKFPEIAKAFIEMLPVVYGRYHDHKIRAQIEKDIGRFAEAGDLVKMAALLSNVEVRDKDFKGFKQAMYEYASLKKEAVTLEAHLESKATFGLGIGRDVSALVSGVLSLLVILGIAFSVVSGHVSF